MSDVLLVDFGALRQASADIGRAVETLRGQLDELEREARPLVATWDGPAREAYERRQAQWRQAAAHLTQIARWADPEMLWREQVAFDLHDAWLRFDLARVRLYDAIANNTGNARACYREAREQLERVYRWGDAVIEDPRYRANFRFMHALFWQLRLDKLYAEHIARGPGGRLAQGRGAVQVGLLLRRLTGIYDGGR